jgi:hypothetical protein
MDQTVKSQLQQLVDFIEHEKDRILKIMQEKNVSESTQKHFDKHSEMFNMNIEMLIDRSY